MLDLYNMIGALIPTAGPTKAHPNGAYREGCAVAVDAPARATAAMLQPGR